MSGVQGAPFKYRFLGEGEAKTGASCYDNEEMHVQPHSQ